MIEKLAEQIEARFAELEQQMSDPEVIGDRERYAEVGREYRQIQPANALVTEYRTLSDDLEGARELLEEGEDEDLEKVVREAPARLEELEEEIRLDKKKKHSIDAVVDRLVAKAGIVQRLTDSIETALRHGQGVVVVAPEGAPEMVLSEHRACHHCLSDSMIRVITPPEFFTAASIFSENIPLT